MIDYQNLASSIDIQQFTGTDGVSWQTWYKPRNAMLIHILCIGAGAGGGSGRIDAGTVSSTGGSGGQPGCITSYYVPAFLIPDTLYMCPGLGGAGGASVSGTVATNGNNGTDGGISYVGVYPNVSLKGNLLLQSSITTAGAGIGGVTGTTYTVGLAPTPINLTTSSSYYLSLGTFSSTNGAAATISTTSGFFSAMVSGGFIQATNAPKAGAGWASTITSIAPSLLGGAAGGGLGLSGISTKKPLFFAPGSGGGSSLTIGGDGGNGANGCGGGGGGAAVTGASNRSGKGGNGGNGIIIITSY